MQKFMKILLKFDKNLTKFETNLTKIQDVVGLEPQELTAACLVVVDLDERGAHVRGRHRAETREELL